MKKIYVAPKTVQMEIELQKMVAASNEKILISTEERTFEAAESRQGGNFSVWGDDEEEY